ncbi:MAG: hypothetical protein L6R19_19030 [Alphaproteobacteria bacterium]|nr:hypothetical protein [Alphaproteobacteria bacterium]
MPRPILVRVARVLAAGLVLGACLLPVTGAQAAQLWVAGAENGGDDANSCTSASAPCRTIQAAVDKAPWGQASSIQFVGCGTFAPVNVYYYKFIGIVGNDGDLSCITIQPPPGRIAVTCQDHAVVTLQYVTLAAAGSGSSGFYGRQYCIADVVDVRYLGFPGGLHNAVTENSRLNCGGAVHVAGGAHSFATASDFSTVTLNCRLVVAAVPFASAFVTALDARIEMAGATIEDAGATGPQFAVMNSVLSKGKVVLPGTAPGTADRHSILR